MRKITREDIQSNEDYLKNREERRKRILALKQLRRVQVGDLLSFAFENRDTVIYQIQEMMRVERITDEGKIQFEIQVYNDLIPEAGSLTATLFIEIPEQERIKPILDSFQGLDRASTVYISVNGEKIFAEFEPGHSKEDRISAVHYVRFHFNKEQMEKFRGADVRIYVEHPAYRAVGFLSAEQKQEIAADFESNS